jgi:transglutaminase-like putative cysteine protease
MLEKPSVSRSPVASATLGATEFLDWESPVVVEFARRWAGNANTPREQAVQLFYGVRDGILYDVYGADLTRPGMKASAILKSGRGFCIHKSIVFAASARCLGMPSRLAFADVRNHLSTARLVELVGGDVFCYHAYAEVWLGGRWLKVTPVFNRALCQLFGVEPLEFDGSADATLQPFDRRGHRYLEVVAEHGSFEDFPYEACIEALRTHHPRLFVGEGQTIEGDLASEMKG